LIGVIIMERFLKIELLNEPQTHIVVDSIEKIIETILFQILRKSERGEYRILYLGDENKFYNANLEDDFKVQSIKCKTYSVPLEKCSYGFIYGFIEAIINDTVTRYRYRRGYTDRPVVAFNGCKVNGENIEIEIGVSLQEE